MAPGLLDRVAQQVAESVCESQLNFVADQSRYVACCCGRQVGKDWTSARIMLLTGLERPGAEIVYVAQTLSEARHIMWQDPTDGLPAVCRELGIPYEANESRLELRLGNGSLIGLTGLDRGAWDKVRGRRLDLLVLTEMQKADDEGLRTALRNVIPAALAAKKGRFIGVGTPEEFCVSVLWEIFETDLWPQFSRHHWDASQNDRRPDIWEDLLEQKSAARQDDDDPAWLREGKGLWVRQDDKFTLPLTETALWDGTYPELIPSLDGTLVPRRLPIEHHMGLDFGFTDSAALTVGSISREEGVLREVHSWKRPGLDTDELAAVVKAAVTRYSVRRIYADAADPKTIADLQRKFRLPIVAAQKHNKTFWIQDMRAKAKSGRFQVLRDSPLHEELKTLRPDPDKLLLKKIESLPGAEDHCWDSARYLYRGVFDERIGTPEPPMTEMQRREAQVDEAFERRLRAQAAANRTTGRVRR